MSDTELPPIGTVVEWRNKHYEIARHCCATGQRHCPNGGAHPLAAHELLTDGTRRYRYALQCIPGDDITIVSTDTSPNTEEDPCQPQPPSRNSTATT